MAYFRYVSAVTALIIAALIATPAMAQKEKKGKENKEAAPAAAESAPAPAASSGSASSGGYKIGVVDIELVVENYPKKKRLMGELETQVASEQAAIDTQAKKLEALQTAYEAGKEKFSDTERSAKQSEIRDLITTVKADQIKKQDKIDQRQQEIKSEVFKDLETAIQAVAKAENYHLVLNTRGLPNAAVLYASPTIDISSKVSTQLGAGN